MKKIFSTTVVISLSIIISSLIIFYIFNDKNYSAKNHCYKKNYANELQERKKRNFYIDKDGKDSSHYTNETMEARSASDALAECNLD